jgi:hypothetical protein
MLNRISLTLLKRNFESFRKLKSMRNQKSEFPKTLKRQNMESVSEI